MVNPRLSEITLSRVDLEDSRDGSIRQNGRNNSAPSKEAPTPQSKEAALRTLSAVRELGPKIRAAADEIEQARRLPLHIVREMQRAGVFRMPMPRAWGGPELDLASQMRVIEMLSMADASAGWCAMIGTDGGYVTAFIDQAVAREMYPDIDSVTAITFAPPGKAVKTKGGFTVSGRWPFASSVNTQPG
ncbi:MAG TPA: acyl-CoA dehydrogenase family protein [Candidatus Sulfotelmatobacter sp.]|nr:acyl-CoA dehydrogenase family protein [Candidatus Sulfotelmatobacter sp.]